MVIPRATEDEEHRAEVHLATYLVRRGYLHRDFLHRDIVTSRTMGYVPGDLFEADWDVAWTVSICDDRREPHTTYRNQSVNGRIRRISATEIRTVTDWTHGLGTDRGSTTFVVYAGTTLPAHAVAMTEGVDVDNRVTGLPERRRDVEQFDASAEDLWRRTWHGRLDAAIDASVRGWHHGDCQKDWRWKGAHHQQATPLFLPIERIDVDFQGTTHFFWMDGANPSRLVHDDLPPNDARIANVALGFLPVALTLVELVVA